MFVLSWISGTLLPTNVSNVFGTKFIQLNTMVESVQQTVFEKFIFIDCLTLCKSRASSVASHSSNLGSATDLMGAIHDLAQSRRIDIYFPLTARM
jgi:hypothetical protein